jgi:hypothetical protein
MRIKETIQPLSNPQSEIRIPQLNAGLPHVKVAQDWKL